MEELIAVLQLGEEEGREREDGERESSYNVDGSRKGRRNARKRVGEREGMRNLSHSIDF